MMQDEQKRILLLEEDFESMRDLKEYIEEELGWYVELTAKKEIVDRLGRERFDLILVDLMIHPVSLDAEGKEVQNVHFKGINWRKTGLEFLRRLRSGEFSQEASRGTSPDVPVIVLSAVANNSVQDELREKSLIQGYEEKPFRLDDLVRRIRGVLQE